MEKENKIIPSWATKKIYTFNEIKEFYRKVMCFPKEIIESIIFYGGTIAYIVSETKNVERKFGDVDWLVHADKMHLVRKYLEKIDSFIIQYDGKKVVDDYNIVSSDGIQEFGFKGSLFGIKLSVHSIAETEDELIISKWVKTNNNNVDLIANVIMLQNFRLSKMIRQVHCKIGSMNIVDLNLIIAWKKKRMNQHDQQDIKFMYDNNNILGIKEENINMFISKMPPYDVEKAYKITPNGIIELNKEKYEEF